LLGVLIVLTNKISFFVLVNQFKSFLAMMRRQKKKTSYQKDFFVLF